jgi:threonine dehydratase
VTVQASALSLERIEQAASVIDPVFLHSPQFEHERLSQRLGMRCVLKIECINPIRSFKGRGTDFFAYRRLRANGAVAPPRPWVTASAGNFGQGLAYAAKKHGSEVIVFAAETANPFKLERMRTLGAEVRLHGVDFDAAKHEARLYAADHGLTFVEDGREPEISEGAGTIALELLASGGHFDAILVPVGNGALINGVGTWVKAHSPRTEVIGVGVTAAPAMERSFRERRPVALDEPAETIADGVAARVAVPEAVSIFTRVADDMLLVEDSDVIDAMRSLFHEAGVVVEGAGAVPLAAARVFRDRFQAKRVVSIVAGGNLTAQQIQQHLL